VDSKVALSCTSIAPESTTFSCSTLTFGVIWKRKKFHLFWSENPFGMTSMSNFLWLYLSCNQSITGTMTHQCISAFSFRLLFFNFLQLGANFSSKYHIPHKDKRNLPINYFLYPQHLKHRLQYLGACLVNRILGYHQEPNPKVTLSSLLHFMWL
jgi:hypothetical protein